VSVLLKYKGEDCMRCTQCKTESTILITVIINGQSHSLCANCMISMQPKFDDLKEIEEQIEEAQKLIKSFEDLARNNIEPDLSNFSEDFSALAFTPSKSMQFTKTILLDLIKQKENLLNEMGEKERLAYKLKEAIHSENYKLAAEIRDSLNKLHS
jgi:protein-arginine kinase activator protein McsA